MKVAAVVGLLGALFLITGCGSAPPPEPVEYTIDMSEFAFAPGAIEAKVGQEVILTLDNVGALEHEIMFGREVLTMEGKSDGYQVDMFELAGVEPVVTMAEKQADEHEEGEEHEDDEGAHSGFMLTMPSGLRGTTLSFTATKEMIGEWEMGCFLLDGVHYDSGMIGTFTVTP